MLRIITASQRLQGIVVSGCYMISELAAAQGKHLLTGVHSTQHARNELVDSITLLHEGHQGGYSALIIPTTPEMREDQFLELLDSILKGHEV